MYATHDGMIAQSKSADTIDDMINQILVIIKTLDITQQNINEHFPLGGAVIVRSIINFNVMW